MNRAAYSEIKSALQQLNWQQLVAALNIPPHVWIGMVMIAAAGLCYSLTVHTRAELAVARGEYEQIAGEVKRLEQENGRLKRELVAVETDARTIETMAREAGMVSTNDAVLVESRCPSQK